MGDAHLVRDIAIALVLALGGGLVAHRLRLSPIVGYLLAGLAIGPFTPGYRADAESLHQLAELGVVFLMFGVGLHFNLGELLAVRRLVLPPALGQIVLTAAGTAGLAMAVGLEAGEAIAFALALSISSTVVLVRALEERGLTPSATGRVLIGWLIVQDLATIAMLLALPFLASGGNGSTSDAGVTAIKALVFAGVTLGAGGALIPRLLQLVARTGSRELFVLVVVCLSLGIAAGAEMAGVSLALGAFIAGVAVSETDSSHQAASDVLPLRDAFAVLFFVSVGMLIDPQSLLDEPLLLGVALVSILFLKPLLSALLTGAGALPAQGAFVAGAGLAQAGEFSFVLAEAGVALELVQPSTYHAILGASAISIALNPLAFIAVRRLEGTIEGPGRLWRWLDRQGEPPEVPEPPSGHVLIVGAGRVGQLAGRALHELGVRHAFVDNGLDQVRLLQQSGRTAFWGDAASADVLEAAGVRGAVLLILAVPDASTALLAARHARVANSDLEIVARAHSRAELDTLRSAPVDTVVVPEFEGAVTIVRETLARLGTPEPVAREIAEMIRLSEYDAPTSRVVMEAS
jgi:CPA2 family monovalent cation:H+ antiporter-2